MNYRLERVAGMTPDEAKAELLDTLKDEVTHESAARIRDAEARAKLQAVLDNGKAAEVFGRMVAAQKGTSDFVENYANYRL